LNAAEQIQIVDTLTNVPLHGESRALMRLNKLCHRATYIFLKRPSDNKLFVQKRSPIKDYCPNYLDPTPGGVVGVGESYADNVVRELGEEMGLSSADVALKRLFTFKYEDDRVDCWGDAWEGEWEGSPEDLTLQETEVSGVQMLSVEELLALDCDKTAVAKVTQDSMHAVRLYNQFNDDARKPLQEYRNADLDKYTLRVAPAALFFDCDDCLYADGWRVADRLTARIEEYCTTKQQLPKGKAYRLYKEHGTALQGLLRENILENTTEAVDGYLEYAHDVDVAATLAPNPTLRATLLAIDPDIPKFIFTASVREHAQACLAALGIADLFPPERIIDTKVCELQTKHSASSFEAAMRFAGVSEAARCLFFDDSVKNIQMAREMGWRGVLVGLVGRDDGKKVECGDCEAGIERIEDMRGVVPEIF